MKSRAKHDWASVDWRKSNKEIQTILGITHPPVVSQWRKKLAPETLLPRPMPAEGMKFPLVFTFTMLEIEDLNARIALFNTKAERKISRARYIARILGLGKNPPSPANHD